LASNVSVFRERSSSWIWNTATELFPQAIQILDRYHAKEALHRTAPSIFGATSAEAKPWDTARCTEPDDGKLQAIISALRPHIGSCNDAAKCATYIIRNRRRMRYPKFHAQGLCTSTGVLEAGCKVAIGTRLKRAGMHWSVSGTNAIIALCQAQWAFRGFLGAPLTAPSGRRVTLLHKSELHPSKSVRDVEGWDRSLSLFSGIVLSVYH
jgi:hypothetical protein